MKKVVIYTVVIALIGIIGYIIYQIATFSLFDVEMKKVAEIKVPNKSYKITLYYIAGNATAQDVIQVKKQFKEGEVILKNYERYNFVNSYEILSDTTLQLILSDTAFTERKADTMLLKIP